MIASANTEPSAYNQFWEGVQPGFKFSDAPVGSPTFFADVERHRYSLEPHIPDLARFAEWRDRSVVEVGCGIATDGVQFARAGALYTGVDQSDHALRLARHRFESEDLEGRFVRALATDLPFASEFDLAYSFGVLHHVQDTEGSIRELHRVLKPGGRALVMLYHRVSLNYYFTILTLRRALAALTVSDAAVRLASKLTREPASVFVGHRELLREHGARYLADRQLFLSNNTDGPGNPLSKVYSKAEAAEVFTRAGFEHVRFAVRFLNLRAFPGGGRLEQTAGARLAAQRVGWHLCITATKPAP